MGEPPFFALPARRNPSGAPAKQPHRRFLQHSCRMRRIRELPVPLRQGSAARNPGAQKTRDLRRYPLMVRLSWTFLTPVVSRAIRTAVSFSVRLVTGPLRVTTPSLVSTLMFAPAIVESAPSFDLTAAVIESSSVP